VRLSRKKIIANRRNALRSSGPLTPFGKLTSSRNARRHGLSIQTAITDEVRQLAHAILEAVPIGRRLPALDNWAHLIAQAEFDIERARAAKRSAYRRIPIEYRTGLFTEAPELDVQQSLYVKILPLELRRNVAQGIREIGKIDRYEKRALSRRRKAARMFRSHVRAVTNVALRQKSQGIRKEK
jgi:hypothetical protein